MRFKWVLLYGMILIAGCLWMGLTALSAGQDINFDLKNYHYYNAYACINDRMDLDIAPAQIQTYFNPLIDVWAFRLMSLVHPRTFGFLVGGFQGISLLFLFIIALEILPHGSPGFRNCTALVLAILGMSGPLSVSQAGTMFHDQAVSVAIHAALICSLRAFRITPPISTVKAGRLLALAGLLLGAATGLKLTFAIYAIALWAAVTAGLLLCNRRWSLWLSISISIPAGFLLTWGYWGLLLWKRFRNPLFPFYNRFFRSPWASDVSYLDRRFLPDSFTEALCYPFRHFSSGSVIEGSAVTDYRIALLLIAMVLGVIAGLYRFTHCRHKQQPLFRKRCCNPQTCLLVFITISYVLWLRLFAYYRYLAPLEHLVPILIFIIIARMVRSKEAAILMTAAVLTGALLFESPPSWGRRDWRDDYVGLRADLRSIEPDGMVLIGCCHALSFVIPHMPPTLRFVRLQSNFHDMDQIDTLLEQEIDRAIRNHKGHCYFMSHWNDLNSSDHILRHYGFQKREEGAIHLVNNLDASIMLFTLESIQDE